MTFPNDKQRRADEPRPGDEIAPTRYRKLPVEIEAIRWSGTNLKELIDFTGLHTSAEKWTWDEYEKVVRTQGFKIFSLEASYIVPVGHYIIRGVKGEFYACEPSIFWLSYKRATTPQSASETVATAAKFALPKLAKGEVWICGMVQPDGRVQHTILLPGESKELNHQNALAWAKKQGGDLPDRVEQAVLFKDHRDKFKREAYWSNTQHADDSSYAWYQGFNNGDQNYSRKDDELLARAVRRVAI